MGGLVVRSACHVARLEKRSWLSLVRRAIYVGTPHRGAPLERMGRTVAKVLRAIDDPVHAAGRASSPTCEATASRTWETRTCVTRIAAPEARRVRLRDPRHPVPLLPEIQHYLVAGSLSDDDVPAGLAALFGDALVPVQSATDGLVDPTSDVLPPSHVKILGGRSHLMLAHRPARCTK